MSKPVWTTLSGDDQFGEGARHFLDHTPERNRERAELARVEAAKRPAKSDFKRFQIPHIVSMVGQVMPNLVSVQPMTAPAGSAFRMEIMPPGESERREQEFEAALRASLGPDEVLREFDDIGVLSGTAGYFVSPASDPSRVLRYLVTTMS